MLDISCKSSARQMEFQALFFSEIILQKVSAADLLSTLRVQKKKKKKKKRNNNFVYRVKCKEEKVLNAINKLINFNLIKFKHKCNHKHYKAGSFLFQILCKEISSRRRNYITRTELSVYLFLVSAQ